MISSTAGLASSANRSSSRRRQRSPSLRAASCAAVGSSSVRRVGEPPHLAARAHRVAEERPATEDHGEHARLGIDRHATGVAAGVQDGHVARARRGRVEPGPGDRMQAVGADQQVAGGLAPSVNCAVTGSRSPSSIAASRCPYANRTPARSASSCSARYRSARLIVWLGVPSAAAPPLASRPSTSPGPLRKTICGVGNAAARTSASAPRTDSASRPLPARVRNYADLGGKSRVRLEDRRLVTGLAERDAHGRPGDAAADDQCMHVNTSHLFRSNELTKS